MRGPARFAKAKICLVILKPLWEERELLFALLNFRPPCSLESGLPPGYRSVSLIDFAHWLARALQAEDPEKSMV